QRDYFRLLAFFDNVEYSVFGKPGSDRWVQEPTLDLPTPEQAKRREELLAERDALNGKLEAPGEEVDAGQAAWERAMRAVDEDWTRLVPVAVHATAATLAARPDGSVLASGKHPGSDEYIVEAELPEGALTGLRLEALPDASLPKGGPGRDYYGNFVL